MTVTLETTTRIVNVMQDGVAVPARVWEGRTDKGVRCHALIVRIAVHRDEDATEFERDLQQQRAPSADAAAIFPLRLVL
jgi:hypothetical protein